MPDNLSLLNSAGFVAELPYGSGRPGQGNLGPPIVTRLLPGASVQERGTGQHVLTGQVSGRQGTLEAYVVTGPQSSASIIAMLTDDKLGVVAIGVDRLNQPFSIVQDVLGNVVLNTFVAGAIPANTPTLIRLVWDSQAPLGVLEAQGTAVSYSYLSKSWIPFIPTSLWVGGAGSPLTYPNFGGTIQKVQVSNVASVAATTSASIETMVLYSELGGVASTSFNATRVPKYTGLLGSTLSIPGHIEPGL